ncbi:SpoIVB peptidase [Bariatricus sp. SGI.161]|uniref:SpoIVB peptidase n=1 Tax=Bariatricus sp. SGI.161 TaxID=3420550 RepID=UPI003CFD9FFE
MRKYWYRRILIMITTFTVAISSGYYMNEYQQNKLQQEVNAETASGNMVIPGGMPIGIYLETEGVMVLGTEPITGEDGMEYESGAHLVKAGDYIVALDDQEIRDKEELQEAVKHLDKKETILKVRRDDEYIDIKLKPVSCGQEGYKLGIWVKDNAQGLGTITFLNADSRFGALGHGIHDVDTNTLLEIDNGTVYETSIKDIKKGENGTPGGMEGIIVYNNYNVLGTITENTDCGIFGTIDRIDSLFTDLKPMETASKEEIEVGPAVIRCAVEGEVKDYEIRITKIDKGTQEINKGIVIEVTDEKLLEITGGIVQGMSGSPIIQNGKLVGAVTHVFVQDATKGYGVFIENMLKNVK